VAGSFDKLMVLIQKARKTLKNQSFVGLVRWSNRYPDWLFNVLFGKGRYEEIKANYGDEDFLGEGWAVAWWRLAVHGKAGFSIGFFAMLIEPNYWLIYPAAVALFWAFKEHNDDVGSSTKRTLDVLSWVFPCVLGQLCSAWIFT